MTDQPGLPSALGIEAVEWAAQGGENLTVRVTGRWRRRRPIPRGQPVLVIEAHGQRHRFPAMPEPPSLTGTAPGTWRLSFSVPASLAPHLGARAWLQLGVVVVPLPVEVEPAAHQPAAEPGAPLDAGSLAERRLHIAELAIQAARQRAAAAEEAAGELSLRIEPLRRELERVNMLLAEHDRARRSAEQRAHAERALREQLQEDIGWRARADDTTDESLNAARERVRELEAEIDLVRRQLDEAEQLADAGQAAAATTRRPPAAPCRHTGKLPRSPSRRPHKRAIAQQRKKRGEPCFSGH